MDARDATEDVLEQAKKEHDAGNYRAGVELLRRCCNASRSCRRNRSFMLWNS